MRTRLKILPFVAHAGLGLFIGFLHSNLAYAEDELTLRNNQTIFGTILVDQANDHVDFQLPSGKVKRIPHSAIQKVERDITPKIKEATGPKKSIGYAAANFGGVMISGGSLDSKILFNYGLKGALITGDSFWGEVALALVYQHASRLEMLPQGVIDQSFFTDVHLQIEFLRPDANGFYFGPSVGVIHQSLNEDDVSVDHSNHTHLELGAEAGYEYALYPHFAFGPEAGYEHGFGQTNLNFVELALSFRYHF